MAIPKPAIVLQDRDLALLRGLFECRVMTNDHIAALYFDGRAEMTKKRLQRLKAAGLIAARKRKSFEPAVLFLTMAGLGPLRERGVLQEYPPFDLPALERRARVSDITLRHELDIMDVKTAFHVSTKGRRELSIPEFSTWPTLYQFEVMRPSHANVLVKPDGFIRIHEKEADGGVSEHAFFLEVDRSTETQDTLVARAGYYLDYYKSGGFAERNGAARSQVKDFPFRVLIVFKTAERRNNTAERLLQHNPPIFTQVWLSTQAEVTTDPLGAIWIRPIDYQKATRGTPFDPEQIHAQRAYQRQTARETFVEQTVTRLSILSE